MTDLQGSLVPLEEQGDRCAAMQGLSLRNVSLTVFENNKKIYTDFGELLFTHTGISGPVVFEISRDVCASKGEWVCSLDLAPSFSSQEITDALMSRKNTDLDTDDLLTGIVHNRLGRVITKEAGISTNWKIYQTISIGMEARLYHTK